MKYFLSLSSLVLSCTLFVCPFAAEAKGGAGKPEKAPKVVPVKINTKLSLITGAPVELSKTHGKIEYQLNKAGSHIVMNVKVPANAASIGIIDLASAKTAVIALSVLREGVSVGECSMELLLDEDDVTSPTKFHFQLNGRVKSKSQKVRFAHGSCLNGMPVILKTDKLSVSALVGGVAVPFLVK